MYRMIGHGIHTILVKMRLQLEAQKNKLAELKTQKGNTAADTFSTNRRWLLRIGRSRQACLNRLSFGYLVPSSKSVPACRLLARNTNGCIWKLGLEAVGWSIFSWSQFFSHTHPLFKEKSFSLSSPSLSLFLIPSHSQTTLFPSSALLYTIGTLKR